MNFIEPLLYTLLLFNHHKKSEVSSAVYYDVTFYMWLFTAYVTLDKLPELIVPAFLYLKNLPQRVVVKIKLIQTSKIFSRHPLSKNKH